MEHERLLINKILEDKTLSPVADHGVTTDYFLDGTCRRVFKALVDYHTEYGEIPPVRRMRQNFPNFDFIEVPEPFPDLLDQIRHAHHLATLEDALSEAVEIFDGRDPLRSKDAITSIKTVLHGALGAVEAGTPNLRDTNLAETGLQRLERYEAMRFRSDELLGIPTGFSTLDKSLQGFQKGQLIVFVGPPKAGKSTMMLLSSLAAHERHKVPLLIGFEMSNEEQEERIDAISAGISHHRLRGADLNEDERKRLARKLKAWDQLADFRLSGDTMSTTTLTGVEAKVDRYQPDLLIVDGVYMMQDENGEKPGSPQALTNITRGFKRLAQNKNIPVIITTQVLEWKMDKKSGITANSVGYSSSFGQDADALIGVESTDDPLVKKVKVVIARNAPPCDIYVRWDWTTGEFTEVPDYDPEAEADDEYAKGKW